jgi:hypothetical protein
MTRRIVLAVCVSLFIVNPSITRLATAAPAEKSSGQVAMEAASRRQQFVFFLFWKDDNPATQAMRQTLVQTLKGRAGQATCVAIQTTDPAEKALVDQFGVSRAPLPLVLAVAPNGAITGGFPQKVTDAQLTEAFVSSGMARCLKALQDRKLVFLCVQPATQIVPAGVQAFQADPQYQSYTEVVALNPADAAEAATLQKFQVDPRTVAVTLFLAPPGNLLGKYDSNVTKQQLIDKLKSSKSAC